MFWRTLCIEKVNRVTIYRFVARNKVEQRIIQVAKKQEDVDSFGKFRLCNYLLLSRLFSNEHGLKDYNYDT